jgi:predicted dehydrogenase
MTITAAEMPLRVGILGANTAIQTTYLPVLLTLKTHYTIRAIYDPNPELAKQCQSTFNIPSLPLTELLHHEEIDLILNLLPMEYHESHTVTALRAGKHVMVEVPLTMSIPSLRRIRSAIAQRKEQHPQPAPPKIFVGCARRYAPCFTEVFKKEILSLPRIYYARCRHIAGPMNPINGKPAIHNNPEAFNSLLADIFGEDITPDRIAFCRYLGMLGCHDLSVMRESLGFPDAVSSVSITDPFYSAIFHYAGANEGRHPFTLLYEAGVDSVPRCDAHLTVYGAGKTVSVQYDFPRPGEKISTGTFVKVVVEEAEEEVEGEIVGDCARRMKRTETVSTCEEAYEREFLALHSYLVGGEAKTSAEDAVMDLRLLLLIFEHYNRQCGTIRTPLG